MEKVEIYVRHGHEYKKELETNNMVLFRLKVDQLISEGVPASDIIIGNGNDLQARIMERLDYGN